VHRWDAIDERLLRMAVAAPQRGVSVREAVEGFGLSASTCRQRLTALNDAGFARISEGGEGREYRYLVTAEAQLLLRHLDDARIDDGATTLMAAACDLYGSPMAR
jgi:transposase